MCIRDSSGSSLLVYKNATDFWIFILYPATLLNYFISLVAFFGGIFGFPVVSSANNDSFTASILNVAFVFCLSAELTQRKICGLPRKEVIE